MNRSKRRHEEIANNDDESCSVQPPIKRAKQIQNTEKGLILNEARARLEYQNAARAAAQFRNDTTHAANAKSAVTTAAALNSTSHTQGRAVLTYTAGLWQRGFMGNHARVLNREYLSNLLEYNISNMIHRKNKALELLFHLGILLAEQAEPIPELVPKSAGLKLAQRYRKVRPASNRRSSANYDDLSAWLRGQNFTVPVSDFTTRRTPTHVQAADNWVQASVTSADAAWNDVLQRMCEKGGTLPEFHMPPASPSVVIPSSTSPSPFDPETPLPLSFTPLSSLSMSPSPAILRTPMEYNLVHDIESSASDSHHLNQQWENHPNQQWAVDFHQPDQYLNVDPRFLAAGWDELWAPAPGPEHMLTRVSPRTDDLPDVPLSPLEDLF